MNAPALGRRAFDQVTPRLIAMLLGLMVVVLTWAAKTFDASKLETTRFVTDSIRRDAARESDRDILLRLDERVGTIYCARLPVADRPGCR